MPPPLCNHIPFRENLIRCSYLNCRCRISHSQQKSMLEKPIVIPPKKDTTIHPLVHLQVDNDMDYTGTVIAPYACFTYLLFTSLLSSFNMLPSGLRQLLV